MIPVALEQIGEAVEITDAEGRFVYVNHAFEELTGYSRAEAIGRTPAEILRSDAHPDHYYDEIWRTASNGGVWRGRLIGRRKDGSLVHQDAVISGIANARGEVDRLVAVKRDVTDQIAAEEAVVSFARFVQDNPNPVFRLNRDGTIVTANAAAHSLLASWDPASLRDEIEVALSSRATVTVEIERGDRALSLTIVPVPGSPRVNVYGSDVTARRRAEERLRRTERLSSLGLVAAGVAHEINNPLAYVLLNLGFLADELPALLERAGVTNRRELLDALSEAREGAERARAIVGDLKTFSRSNREDLAPVNIDEVVRSTANIARVEVGHRARLVLDLSGPPPAHGNESRLGQVVLNLIVNAAQAIGDGTSEDEIRVATRLEGDCVVIDVSDTGPGVPQALRERIFDPFFTTKQSEGTGLGLSICHDIVSQHGGELELASRPEGGTTFTVRLPVAERASAASEGATGASAPRRARVLVVDDEPMIARSLARILSTHDVSLAKSGAAALELLEAGEPFDVVLCDLHMPDTDGIELYEHLASQGAGPPFVLMSGGATSARAREFLATFGGQALSKPCRPDEVRRAIAEALERD